MQGVWSKSIPAGALRRQTDRFAENTLRGERYDLRNAPLEQSRLHAPYVNNPVKSPAPARRDNSVVPRATGLTQHNDCLPELEESADFLRGVIDLGAGFARNPISRRALVWRHS